MRTKGKKISCFAVGIIVIFLNNATIAAEGTSCGINVKVITNRPEAIYKRGERATFSISVTDSGQPMTQGIVEAELSLNWKRAIVKKKFTMGQVPANISGTLSDPGFLNCLVYFTEGRKYYSGRASAGFEPELIRSMTERPEDFHAFWAAGRAELSAIPVDVELTLLPQFSDRRQDSYKISFANVGNSRIYGYLSVPKDKLPPYPGYVIIAAAGIREPKAPITGTARQGALTLYMGVHAHDLGLQKKEYERLEKGPLRDYFGIGAPDRDRYYFRRAILGINRAVNYIATRADFDGEHLVIDGTSQGGGLALILAGLNHHITAVSANAPGFCDSAGRLAGRMSGGAFPIPDGPLNPQSPYLRMSAYFDAANFASEIKCPTTIFVGFTDEKCPPSSIYAVYNNITAPKRIFNAPLIGHAPTPEYLDYGTKWVDGQLGLRALLPPSK
jgi:cephalosporin-C deacetylase